MKFCLVNGVQQNHIDVENRGLAYGDGLFTTAKIENGHIQCVDAHIERLISGCERLGISPPTKNTLTNDLSEVAKPYSLAVLKVIITAGSGGRGYGRANSNDSDLIIMIHDYPSHYDALTNDGVKLGISKQQLGLNPMLAGLKHLNRLEQVLLRQELSNQANDDLLVTNINQEVIEATSANMFFFSGDILFTPDINQSGVNGIMRQAILACYPATIIKTITINEIAKAEEIFICNCVMGVMPVASLNGRKLNMSRVRSVRERMIKEASSYV